MNGKPEPPSIPEWDHPSFPDWDELNTPEVTPDDRYIVIQVHGYGHDVSFPDLGYMASPAHAAAYTYANTSPLLFVYDRATGELHTIEVE